jgi:alkanesulfonate monooxygenase SsuD/methylene tetrahydromethanopterin reductase-like flavin-dependent oxidoreductase (luciferase family)
MRTPTTGIGILPRPKRTIPIWLGGFREAAFDRAARIGDGFLFSGQTQTEAIQINARIAAREPASGNR